MERLMPEMLRAYADALEDKRRLVNVESLRRTPEHDQHMLLALNGIVDKEELPDERAIVLLRERLISITTADEQGTTLGLFYTNAYPCLKRMSRLAVGVFPLHGEVIRYSLRPNIESSMDSWQRSGRVALDNVSAPGNDPFKVDNYKKGPDLIFFNKSPDDESYRTILPTDPTHWLPDPKLHDDVLEQNVIQRAVWYTDQGMKPYLFLQDGFRGFMREHRHDPRYAELYEGYRKNVFPRTGFVEHNI